MLGHDRPAILKPFVASTSDTALLMPSCAARIAATSMARVLGPH